MALYGDGDGDGRGDKVRLLTQHAPQLPTLLPTSRDMQLASTVPDYIVLFVIIMASAFVTDLFSPDVAHVLRTNKWAKHTVALSLLALTVVWGKQAESWGVMAIYVVAVYLWYLALIGMNTPQFFAVMVLLVVVFVVSHTHPSGADDVVVAEDAERHEEAQAWQYWTAVAGVSAAAALTTVFASTNSLRAFMDA